MTLLPHSRAVLHLQVLLSHSPELCPFPYLWGIQKAIHGGSWPKLQHENTRKGSKGVILQDCGKRMLDFLDVTGTWPEEGGTHFLPDGRTQNCIANNEVYFF